MPTKIVVTDYLEPNFDWEKEQLRSRQFDFLWQEHQLKFAPADDLVQAIGDADVVVVNMAAMNADVISRLPKCKLIIRHGIGYDNVDLKAATAKGIRVANIPDYCPEEVAEQAVMLIFAAARHLPEQLLSMNASMAKGTWDFSPVRSVYMMEGKTLGLVGCGRIGRRVYRLASGFGMRRLVCDPYLSDEERRELGLENTVSLETLLRESDIVSLHTPLNDETRSLINARTLAMMKRTAVLVNTARGPLVVEQDLCDALNAGTIAGAACDVVSEEPIRAANPLLRARNLTLTPHIAWAALEARRRLMDITAGNIAAFLAGNPANVVNG